MSGRSVVQTLPAWLQRRLFEWRRDWQRRHLKDPRRAFLSEPPPPEEWVALYCGASGQTVLPDALRDIGHTPLPLRLPLTLTRLVVPRLPRS